MKKNQIIHAIIIFTIIVIIISACTSQPQETEPTPQATDLPTQTVSPAPVTTEDRINGYLPITPDNFTDMELITELGSGATYDVAVSPDGKSIAVMTKYKLIVYDRKTFQEKYNKDVSTRRTTALTFSPDGKQIVYFTGYAFIFLDADSGEPTHVFYPSIDYYQVQEISFTPKFDRISVKGRVPSGYCDGGAFNYTLYTLEGVRLFDQQYCGYAYFLFTKAINDEQTFFTAYSGDAEVFPYEMYIIENETGNILAAEYNRRETPGDSLKKYSLGDISILPSKATFSRWDAEYRNNLYSQKSLPCFEEEKPDNTFKILAEDDTSALLAFGHPDAVVISGLDLASCQYSGLHLSLTEAFTRGEFSSDDRYFVYSNSNTIRLLDIESNTLVHSEDLNYLEYNKIDYEFNADGTRLLVWNLNKSSEFLANWKADTAIDVLDTSTGKRLRTFPVIGTDISKIIATPNPEIVMVIHQNRNKSSSLWNIETGTIISNLPRGAYLFDAARDSVWILDDNQTHFHGVSIFDLSTGKKNNVYLSLYYTGTAHMELIENGNVLKINYGIDRDTNAEMKLDIENNIVLSDIKKETETIRHENQISEYSKWSFNKYDNRSHIIFQDSTGYDVESTYVDDDPFIITDDHFFWNKKTGEHIGQLDTDFAIDELFFSPNQYFLAAIGTDGIIRIFGVKENQ